MTEQEILFNLYFEAHRMADCLLWSTASPKRRKRIQRKAFSRVARREMKMKEKWGKAEAVE
jgi:hypothetical protein